DNDDQLRTEITALIGKKYAFKVFIDDYILKKLLPVFTVLRLSDDPEIHDSIRLAVTPIKVLNTCDKDEDHDQYKEHMCLGRVHICYNEFYEKVKCTRMFMEGVHICSNEFDEKTQCAHMFFEDVHICSNEFD
ncbi:hypothetical protein Tco_0075357, partial [Tanacetum coccineum]